MRRTLTRRSFLGLSGAVAAGLALTGCEGERSDGRTEVEFVSYKREAVSIFEALMAEFNETNDHIYLNFTSPNDAVTIMKTRFVREDYPDVVAIPTPTSSTPTSSPTSPTIPAWPRSSPPTRRS